MDGHALHHAVHRTGGARRVGGVAHAHGVDERHRLGNHHERQRQVGLRQLAMALEGEGLTRKAGLTSLLNRDGLLRDLVACDLVQDVEIVLTGVGVVVHEHEHKGLVVHEALGPMAITHGAIPRGRNETMGELENLELRFLGKAHVGAGTQIGHTVEVAGQVRGDLVLASHDLAAHLRRLAHPSELLLVGGSVEDEGREQLHAAVAAGHREALIVRTRNEQGERVRVARALNSETSLRSAGDVQELDVLDVALGNLDGGKALGAVAGASKRHQDRRVFRTKEVARRRDDIGRSDRLEIVRVGIACMTQVGRNRIAHIVRRAGTSEDHRDTTLGHGLSRCEEGLDGLFVIGIDLEGVLPKIGLLHDLGGRDIGTELLQLLDGFSKHLCFPLSMVIIRVHTPAPP